MDASAATCTKTGRAPFVIDRRRLEGADGKLVVVHIPKTTKVIKVMVSGVKRSCTTYLIGIPGGYVCVYVHQRDPKKDLAGTRIAGKLYVFRETFSHGCTYDAIHIVETHSSVFVQTWRVVEEQYLAKYEGSRHRVMKLPPPLRGAVVLTDLDRDHYIEGTPRIPKIVPKKPRPDLHREKGKPASNGPRGRDVFRRSQHSHHRSS